MTDDDIDRIAGIYGQFAEVDAAVVSPVYAELAAAVAGDPVALRFLAGLPGRKGWQPMLLFAAARVLSGGVPDPAALRRMVADDTDRLRRTMTERATQTNEAARCAALLPLLADLAGPVALVEVGASAGLCLHLDRYRYVYDGGAPVGPPSPVELHCTTTGDGPIPHRAPEVAARIGVDLNPLDLDDPDVRAWLRALIWPGPYAADRLARLDAAAELARTEPVQMLTGDLVDRLPDALALVPEGATPVVFHTAVLVYLPGPRRAEFEALVRGSGVRWIAQEAPQVLPGVAAQLPDADQARGRFLLSLDSRPVAWTAPHGGRIDWLPGARGMIAG